MSLNGYVKVFRSLKEWEWYKNIETSRLFIHILLSANFKENKFEGIIVKRGQYVTSYRNLAYETGLSERKVRTILGRLEKTGELTRESTHKFTIITVVNWDKYQGDMDTETHQPTSDRHTTDIQPTSDRQQLNNDNNSIMEERKKDSLDQTDNFSPSGLVPYPQSIAEVREYCEAEGLYTDPERFYSVNDAAGWKDKSGAQIRDWKALCRGPVWNVKPADPVQEQHTRVDQETKANSLSHELWSVYSDLSEDGEIEYNPIPPTSLEEVLEYCAGYSVHSQYAEEFYLYFKDKVWKVSEWIIRDWKLAFQIWAQLKEQNLNDQEIVIRMRQNRFSSLDSMFFCTEEERNKIKEKIDWRVKAAR